MYFSFVLELGDGSAASLAWRLLEQILLQEEVGLESVLHRAITIKLLHIGVFLPQWLVASYKVGLTIQNFVLCIVLM